MRAHAFVLVSLLASPAFAGSFEVVKSLPKGTETESVLPVTCPTCQAAPLKTGTKAVDVVTLKPGEQKIELKTINGEEKIVRTEAWLGGSPVVFVSKATPEMIAAYFPGKTAPDGIDSASKTAALPDDAKPLAAKAPVVAGLGDAPAVAAEQKPLDMSGFSLRTN